MQWREVRPQVFVSIDLPNCSIYRLKYGGWRYQIGGRESATYGDRAHAERQLVKDAHTLTPFERPA